jgi:ATP-binding cassette, subfamily C (CFTR/MRP), member 1
MNNYTLVWWQEKYAVSHLTCLLKSNTIVDSIFGWAVGYYMALYAGLGISQAVFTFGLGGAMGWQSYLASKNLHRMAIQRVFLAPMEFFDTNPLGRILGVFGKDIDTIDNQLAGESGPMWICGIYTEDLLDSMRMR